MDGDDKEASPMKAVAEEVRALRTAFRETVDGYAARMDQDIVRIETAMNALTEQSKISGSKIRDMRDMLTLLRRTQVKSGKGRRKDLKKMDSLVSDLLMLIENWK